MKTVRSHLSSTDLAGLAAAALVPSVDEPADAGGGVLVAANSMGGLGAQHSVDVDGRAGSATRSGSLRTPEQRHPEKRGGIDGAGPAPVAG